MGTVTLVFLSLGGLSLLVLLLSLVGGHLHIGHLHLGHGHGTPDGGAWASLPALSGFVGAFGFGGAIAAELVPGHGVADLVVGGAVGLAAALPTGWVAGRLTQAAMNMPDGAVTGSHLVGATGVMVTASPGAGRFGEARLTVAGQPMKFNVRSEVPLSVGTSVLVIESISPTCVLVEPTPQFFDKDGK